MTTAQMATPFTTTYRYPANRFTSIKENPFVRGEVVFIPEGSTAYEVFINAQGIVQKWFHAFTLPYNLSIEVTEFQQETPGAVFKMFSDTHFGSLNVSAVGFENEHGRTVMIEISDKILEANNKPIRWIVDKRTDTIFFP